MKIVLAFEHIRRLAGARSQIVSELGVRLARRGHEVTIVCDCVIDPPMFPELKFIARRRTIANPQSHRLIALNNWARRILPAIDHDVSLSFFPAIPADVVCPLFGWIENRLADEHAFLRRPVRRAAILAHPNVIESKVVERRARRSAPAPRWMALSEAMEAALFARHGSLARRVVVIPGASPIEPPGDPDAVRSLRDRTRRALGVNDETVVFLWSATNGLWHGRSPALQAFARASRDSGGEGGGADSFLLMAGEGQWIAHELAVKLRCDDRVLALGRTSEMASLWAAADVGLIPAIHSVIGRSAWESLAFGKPVITSERTAGRERMITDSAGGTMVAGRVVAANDVDVLTYAVRDMLDAHQRANATAAAREIAPTMRFESFVNRVEELLKEVAAERGGFVAAGELKASETRFMS